MNILRPPYRRDVLLITLAALAFRLIVLPYSHTVHADAVSRIHIAYEWMLNPHYISEGDWGPLHHYLNALFMMIFPGKVLGPNLLNILCASLTAIPLYGIALNLFGSRRGAIFTALLYVFSPIVIWTSLQALSEAPYGLFLALALFHLSKGIVHEETGYRNAIWGGAFMTLAAAIRYEAWVLIAVLTLVLLLQRNWRYTLVFWLCAMIFPATWMIGNQLEYGNALHSISKNDTWFMAMEGINDEISNVDRVKRAVFFPWSLMVNASPICMFMLVLALAWAGFKRKLTRAQLLWMLPFVVMVIVLQIKAWEGSISLHHRFVVTWLILLLPFVSLVFVGADRSRLRTVLMVIGVITLIPLAFFWNKIEYIEHLGDSNVGHAMDELAMGHYREMQVVPRFNAPETGQLLADINNWDGDPGNGLLLDFFGWDRTYYVALLAPHHTMVIGGAKHAEYDPAALQQFLSDHPNGQAVFSRTGMLHSKATLRDGILEFEDVDLRLTYEDLAVYRGLRRLTYHVILTDDVPPVAEDAERVRLFAEANDPEYFQARILEDDAWFSKVSRQSFWKGEPIDTTIQRNVEYMMSLEE